MEVPHRSCGIALAETFNLATTPYQCLRNGGITGKGECGAIKAGELILGEYLGDPDFVDGKGLNDFIESAYSSRQRDKKIA